MSVDSPIEQLNAQTIADIIDALIEDDRADPYPKRTPEFITLCLFDDYRWLPEGEPEIFIEKTTVKWGDWDHELPGEGHLPVRIEIPDDCSQVSAVKMLLHAILKIQSDWKGCWIPTPRKRPAANPS